MTLSFCFIPINTFTKQRTVKLSPRTMVALKNMGHLVFLPLLILSILISTSSAKFTSKVGINYGQLGNNLPSPSKSVELIKSLKAKLVKIYDTNPKILNSLKHTNIKVSVMLPNELISNISSNQTLSDLWVRSNVQPFYPHTKIRFLLVGNEIISSTDNKTWYNLVPAMRKIKSSLKAHGIHKVKVGTSCAMDVLESSYPPSNGTFRADISGRVMKPMLQFLSKTRSFFFLDAYPYFPWSWDPTNIKLDYALFESKNFTYTDPGSGLVYTNLFDQMVDAVIFAMRRLGYPGIRVWIAETGWPNGGDFDQIGCNIYNAATYNRNVVKKLTSESGTPARPGKVLPSFIFSLYNENQKPGPGTERHFGLLYPNGSKIYEIDLSGETQVWKYKKPLPKPTNDEKYKGKTPMSYSDPQPPPQPPPLPIRCTNIAPPPPLAPNPYYPWPPPVPDLETLDPPPLPPYPPPLHDPYYPWLLLPPPPSSNSEEAWYMRATPLLLFLILLVALISGLTTLFCKCFFGRWISNPSNSITAATSPPVSINYELSAM